MAQPNAGNPGGAAAGAAAAPQAPVDQIALLTQLVAQLTTARLAAPRPKAINCRIYKLSDSFPDYATYFSHCIKAAYNYNLPADRAALDDACVSWIASKLEPGPTLVAYDALDAAVKADWDLLVENLSEAFSDDTERELFLGDVASFRRGEKGLVEYKNELLRKMKLYQPDLSTVPLEFQRQATSRFIEGLDDAELKRKLRRHCKRDKLTIEEAFHYTVDHEASSIQTQIREGDAAAFSKKAFATTSIQSTKDTASRQAGGTTSHLKGMQEEIQGLSAKHKITELQINELTAKAALTDDRITIVSKEVGQVAVNVARLENSMDKRLGNIESLIRSNHSSNYSNTNPNPQYGNQFNTGANQYQRQANFRGRGGLPYNRQPHPQYQQRLPSLTGGPGYVNNTVQPSQLRMQGPQTNIPVRPPTSAISTATTNVSSMAAFGAISSASAVPPSRPIFAAAAAAVSPDVNAAHLQQQQNFDAHASGAWWSPGMYEDDSMASSSASGYDESLGNYSYGHRDF